jgi:hypothetical protein
MLHGQLNDFVHVFIAFRTPTFRGADVGWIQTGVLFGKGEISSLGLSRAGDLFIRRFAFAFVFDYTFLPKVAVLDFWTRWSSGAERQEEQLEFLHG